MKTQEKKPKLKLEKFKVSKLNGLSSTVGGRDISGGDTLVPDLPDIPK